MNNGKHAVNTPKRSSGKKRSLSFIVALVLLVTLAIGGTIAYLTQTTSEVKNTFTSAGAPTPVINETFDGTTKSDVYISLNNDGTGSYFVRAAVVISFQDDAGNTVAKVPADGTDYSITMGSDWTKNGDYYYYNGTVVPGGFTTYLINSCTTLSAEYKLVVDIIAQTIQANPTSAASDQWGYVPSAK